MTETLPDQPLTRRALRAQRRTDTPPAPPAPDAVPVPDVAPVASGPAGKPARSGRRRRVGTVLTSIAAAVVVGLVAVGMTTPASAVAAAGDPGRPATAPGAASYASAVRHGQDYHAGTSAVAVLSRESFATGAAPASVPGTGPVSVAAAGLYSNGSMLLTTAQMLADNGYNATTDLGYNAAGWGNNPSPIPAGFSQVSNKYFVNDPGGKVQWPFAVGCPITYGFGWRPGEFHQGADFTPGAGAPIQSIADGVVSMATDNFQGYGAVVVINHVVDGQRVASLYAHLIIGSIRVVAGQHVSVGQEIGQVGASGHAFGANMHFEILAGGTTPVDPVGWLRAHAGP